MIATFNRNTDPNGGGGALSAFKGVLKAGNIKAANGGKTVVFYLDAPTAAFPYLCSNTTYQTIIQPSTYKLGQFAKGGTTTGALPAGVVHAGRRRQVRPQPELVGRHDAARRRRRRRTTPTPRR